ncbi:MAG TPA: methylmalonyl-CoA mutase family protein [Geobacterales bacterium]|nr:methylmalonyl-CoA mutase family protein [Geobacterales bacterium]
MITSSDLLKDFPKGYWKRKLEEKISKRNRISGLYNKEEIEKLGDAEYRWRSEVYEPWIKEKPERKSKFETASGIELKPIYTPYDIKHIDYLEDLNFPGCYPYTRGVYPSMYRGRLWTIREFSGFGTPEDTNKRLKFLLEHGETGLSIAFDMPTLYGYDSDSPRAFGEVGKMGVSVSSLQDMEALFKDIPLDQVTTSMTINAPAIVLLALYIAVAEKQGVPIHRLSGTIQNDILKEYIAQKEWAFPPEAHLRIIRDMMEFCSKNMPKWNYISISGYHIREAGANAIQELAFTLMDGFTYVELGMSAGLDPNEFATRLSFFFNSTMDFFEEIAKFRAARRIWATVLKERYGVKNPRALLLRFHTQTSGASLTWQQPLNNIVRTAIEALAAVLGGTQSLHTNSYDEALCLPTEEAVVVAVRTQQIIAHETNVASVIDPLAGSYYVEWLTDKLEEEAYRYFDKIEELGGMVEAIKKGYPQKEIIENAYRQAMKVENKEDIIVGVNEYIAKDERIVNVFKTNPEVEKKQRERIQKLKQSRDNKKVKEALEEVRRAFEDPSINLMYPILKAVKAYATLQEIMDIGREVYGTWKEPSIL